MQWALYRSPQYWKDPLAFRPERFLGDPEFSGDRPDVLQPFVVGPRNCLGRKYVATCPYECLFYSALCLTECISLAYAEMRLILARMLYNFDLKLPEESKGWIDRQKVYVLWDNIPLPIYLKIAER